MSGHGSEPLIDILKDAKNVTDSMKYLKSLLCCDKCLNLPTKDSTKKGSLVIFLSSCGHSICGANDLCNNGMEGGGSCPVDGCGVHVAAKNIIPDIDQANRIEAFNGFQSVLFDENWSPQKTADDVTFAEKKEETRKREVHKKAKKSIEVKKSTVINTDLKVSPKAKTRNGKLEVQNEPKFFKTKPKPRIEKAEHAVKVSNVKKTPAKSDVNRRNKNGETNLHAACRKLEVAKAKDLLEAGADPNTQDNAGWTPLHEVAQKSHLELVALLLKAGVNPNVPGGDENYTPLHDAVISGSREVVKILIEHGAKKDYLDSNGKMPRDLTNDPNMIKLLEKTQSKVSDEQLNETIVGISGTSFNLNVVVLVEEKSLVKIAEKKWKQEGKNYTLDTKHTSFLDKSLTHLVVGDVDENRKMRVNDPASLTGYYEALLLGAWIVTKDWLTADSTSDEAEYEVKGLKSVVGAPEASRINRTKQLPRLLDGMKIYLQGTFGSPYPDRNQIAEILRKGGATVLKREPDPEGIPEHEQKHPYHASADGPLTSCSYFIIYQEGSKREPELKYTMKHIKTLPLAWLFECFNNHKLIDPFF